MTENQVVETDRLLIRGYRADDIEPLLSYYSIPAVARHLIHGPWDRARAEEQVAKQLTESGIDGAGTAWAVVVEHQGEVVGDIALWASDATGRRGEVGWVFHPAHSGQGFATEAVGAVLRSAFERFSLHRAVAQMDARNVASARRCERLGVQREAHLRKDQWVKGEWADVLRPPAVTTCCSPPKARSTRPCCQPWLGLGGARAVTSQDGALSRLDTRRWRQDESVKEAGFRGGRQRGHGSLSGVETRRPKASGECNDYGCHQTGTLAEARRRGFVMDGLDALSVGEVVAAAQPEVIVNQMTGLSERHAGKPNLRRVDRYFATTNQLRTEGIDHLLAAAQAGGRRLPSRNPESRQLPRGARGRLGWTLRYPSWRQGTKEELTMHREEMP